MISHSTINTWFLILISEWLFLPLLHSFIQTREQLLREWYLSKFHLFPFYTKPLPMLWGMRVKMDSFIRNNLCPWETWILWEVKILWGKFHPFHLLCCFFSDLAFPNCYFVLIRSIFWFLVSFSINCMTAIAFMIFPSTALLWFGNLLFILFFGHKACGILVLWSGTEHAHPALKVCSLNQWTTREVLKSFCWLTWFFKCSIRGFFFFIFPYILKPLKF